MMFEFDEDYGYTYTDPYEYSPEEEYDIMGPYPPEYSKRPIPDSKVWSIPGTTHHPECYFDAINLDTCNCRQLYERDYQETQEKELEDMHETYWQ
jgi:hypothetical protein